jgi:LPXTG-site transpeptidase (sortase) family protein
VVCLALFFWYEFEASYFQASLSHRFDEQRLQPSRQPQSVKIMPGVVGRLDIPRIGVEVMVLKGVDLATLRRGAGWLPGTAQPGNGNSAIAAHRDTFFRPLRQIKEGDVIRLTTLDGCYNFQVDWAAVVDPADTSVLRPTREPVLTLITCYPFSYVGKAPQRFIVRASRQEPLVSVARELFDTKNPAVQPHDRCSSRGT